jgi:hypothetical protein
MADVFSQKTLPMISAVKYRELENGYLHAARGTAHKNTNPKDEYRNGTTGDSMWQFSFLEAWEKKTNADRVSEAENSK